ncbi:MAG: response regulator [Myxococcota bacterium]|nr:response regulator [Myxococcota bacterium]
MSDAPTTTSGALPKMLVVDDEDAILETMEFTFEDEYEVVTSTDARRALDMLDEHAPVSVVITDQRMPEMTGSEFLAEVYARHPDTSRIILTGFADMASTGQAINDGHVYAYVNKPWETDDLKQVVRRAYEHHALLRENHRLIEEISRTNRFLEAVIDRLDTGALAVDADGIVQAANHTAREILHLPDDPRGVSLKTVMECEGLEDVASTVSSLAEEGGGRFEDADLSIENGARRIRVSLDTLGEENGKSIGRVILFKEVSHEPLRRRFEEVVIALGQHEGEVRGRLEEALGEMRALGEELRASGIASPGMTELGERASRAQTAIQSWLDVDDLIAREDYPDAQLLRDRMSVATHRWPAGEALPARVGELAARVEAYYESGENKKERVL